MWYVRAELYHEEPYRPLSWGTMSHSRCNLGTIDNTLISPDIFKKERQFFASTVDSDRDHTTKQLIKSEGRIKTLPALTSAIVKYKFQRNLPHPIHRWPGSKTQYWYWNLGSTGLRMSFLVLIFLCPLIWHVSITLTVRGKGSVPSWKVLACLVELLFSSNGKGSARNDMDNDWRTSREALKFQTT